jgi:hypothetical protein
VIIVRSAGKARRTLVATNRHVVEYATRTKIAVDGADSLFDAQVVFVDPHHDVAVLEVLSPPDRKLPFEAGVTLETKAPRDQQPVVAAGYPGMGSRPSYQVTKGYISNRRVQLDGDAAPYIQHTAAIDPGSSGGPLLSEDGRLLGINTLKMHGREGVGLAVPGDVVAEAVRAADAPPATTVSASDDARRSCLATLADVTAERTSDRAMRHLSPAFVADVGPAALTRLTRTTAEQQSKAGYTPQRASLISLYGAALHRLQQALKASGGVSELEMCENVALSTGEDATLARFIIQTVRGPRELKLVHERGYWTVLSFDFRDAPTDSVPPAKGEKPKRGPR